MIAWAPGIAGTLAAAILTLRWGAPAHRPRWLAEQAALAIVLVVNAAGWIAAVAVAG